MTASNGRARPQRRRKGDPELVAALAAGQSYADAAAAAGVSKRTARRRMTESDFRAEVDALRADMFARAVGRMAGLVDEAAETLRDVMRDPEAPAGARVSAARAVLQLGADLRERLELVERIEALEAATVPNGRQG